MPPSSPRPRIRRRIVHRPRTWVWALGPWLFLLLVCWTLAQPPSIVACHRRNLNTATRTALRRLTTYCREIIVLSTARLWEYIQDVLLPSASRSWMSVQDEHIPWILRQCKDGLIPWTLRQSNSFPEKMHSLYAGWSLAITRLGSAWETLSRIARKMFTGLKFSTARFIEGVSARWEDLSNFSTALVLAVIAFWQKFKLQGQSARATLDPNTLTNQSRAQGNRAR